MIQINSIILTAALLGHASAQGCYPAYIIDGSYSAGEMVSATTIIESTSTESCTPPGTGLCPSSGFETTTVTTTETHNYECKSEPSSQFCSQSAFAPNGIYSGQAWIKESAECTGNASIAPATVPVPVAWSDGLCPSSGFETTTVTTTETHNYECKSEPSSQFCSQSAFAPNGIYSGQAWIMESAECTGTAVSPAATIPAAWSGVGCPAAFSAGATYDAADVVSVAETGFIMVYQCADEPTNEFCGQNGYEPGTSQFSEQAWTALGSCMGTIAPTSSPSFDTIMDAGGCPAEYAAGAGYGAGDQVSKDGLVYECGPEPMSGHCSQIGYEPGTSTGTGAQIVEYWRQAWTVVGVCDGTIAPTTAPSFDVLTDVGGCPDVWSVQTYEEGDRVSSMDLVYECAADPLSRHCGQAGYEPNTNPSTPDAWKSAWTLVGYCSGSIGPTSSPSFDPANSVGGCPEEWERGSNVSYDEGDMVNVVVSTMPLRQIAYRCKAWPLSGHCGQFSPIENGGDLGWTFAGSCDGSIGPTASPSFDALTVDASGCPEEFSASKTDYEAGDLVSFSVSESPSRDLVYQCREYPNVRYCNQGATFAPNSQFGTMAWTLIGACSGTLAPTGSPVQYMGMCQFDKCVIVETVQPNCVPGSDGCSCLAGFPAGADCVKTIETENCTPQNVNPWSSSVQYVEDDVVRLGAKQFKCREWPNFIWCSLEAYMPTMDEDDFWPQAWTAIQDCPP
eukprot:CAMPEP_0201681400 /NCGR_PEP_ID=MMETSP0494-20130426/51093_1 /ASSEMBLY_ACC=CAM_ASM_000839 /TAXON_ID=420259 /ORGANISM="Thalassiosira gravida, Strain GMp14c1" /LENGTH=730 /DNA_ID=CAMNT_0048165147 /DNA_START=146 /DNA_END=2338 /DNA_ORIENTATION=-